MQVGIVGTGAIGLACAAWLGRVGHAVGVLSPRGGGSESLRHLPLESSGTLKSTAHVRVFADAADLAAFADVVLIAVPVNGHRAVADALLPHLRAGQVLLVSSMASLSALYLHEQARARGIDVVVASFGTTVLTARRVDATHVHIMTRRSVVGLSSLPNAAWPQARDVCRSLFGGEFTHDQNVLATSLSNINPVAHPPLVIFNWTRIERPESWPQYHFMTPRVAAVIERLDEERRAVATAFGLQVRTIEQHFQRSFNSQAGSLAEIAAEMHEKRGGPPGPTDTQTRFLAEDVPYGLVFITALGRIAGVPTPATRCMVGMSSLIAGETFENGNDLIPALKLSDESVDGLLARINVGD